MRKRIRRLLLFILVLLIAVIGAAGIYVGNYYHASEAAEQSAAKMEVIDGGLLFRNNSDTGIMIYPGGKVDERAYAPLAEMLYEEGYTVAIVKMPLRLSIISSYRGLDVMEEVPEIRHWVIAGHSLGGTSAGMLVDEYPDQIDGIVFMGSYPYKDISDYQGFVLTVNGSNDLVLNTAKAKEAAGNYPAHAVAAEISGGNHAGFGSYGEQKGDGDAKISWQEQQEEVVEWIVKMIEAGS